MNSTLVSSLRSALVVSALFVLPAFAVAGENSTGDDAARLLAISGNIPVRNVGPHVEAGTYRIQVSAKLGQPHAKLADGTWLYRNFTVEQSNATGTLVVRFDHGRVSQLALVTPKVELAMLNGTSKAPTQIAAK